MEPTINEKFKAIRAIDPSISVKLNTLDEWYVSTNLEIANGRFLSSVNCKHATPEGAIEECWKKLTNLPEGHDLRIDNRSIRWNGFMWEELR